MIIGRYLMHEIGMDILFSKTEMSGTMPQYQCNQLTN
jgi:hypothetical protein